MLTADVALRQHLRRCGPPVSGSRLTRATLPTEQFRSSVLLRVHIDLEFTVPDSLRDQETGENILDVNLKTHYFAILTARCIEFFLEYPLYKLALYF